MTSSDEDSLQEVADTIKAGTRPGADRVRALHDWVADRIAYDAPAYAAKQYPEQDADTVFRRRTAVCAGYAHLLKKLGDLAGENIVYLYGDAGGPNGLEGHAWNAAKVENGWTLIDATWDSGYVDGQKFIKRFDTAWLFAPPAFFVASHLPANPKWQLLERPLDRGEFLRTPKLTASFFRAGLKLVEPTRSLVDALGSVDIVVENPEKRYLSAQACAGGKCERCRNEGKVERLTCPLPGSATNQVRLFAGVDETTNILEMVLELDVNNR